MVNQIMELKIHGIDKVNRFMTRLPKQINVQIGKQGEVFMKAVRKSAKLRAPRWTGALARSITYAKKGKREWKIVVESPYAYFQEFGFRPHYVQLWRPTRAGAVVADWAASKGIKTYKGSIFVSGYKPFIIPALEMQIARLPSSLSMGLNNAVRRAKR